jgi:hypothetical protein
MTTELPHYTPVEIEAMLRDGRWWPFDRVDGKLLQRLHKKTPPNNPLDDEETAPW